MYSLNMKPAALARVACYYNRRDDDMCKVERCDKCRRTDVEGALCHRMNFEHWRECMDLTTGRIVGGTLLQCPARTHWVCADCVRANWWGVRGRRHALCPCVWHWPLGMLAVVGVSSSQMREALTTPIPTSDGVCIPNCRHDRCSMSGECVDKSGWCDPCSYSPPMQLVNTGMSCVKRNRFYMRRVWPPPKRARGPLPLTTLCRCSLSSADLEVVNTLTMDSLKIKDRVYFTFSYSK